jgi:hypothetical protein
MVAAAATLICLASAAGAEPTPYPAQLAELVQGIRAAALALPAGERDSADAPLLHGPIARLQAVTLRDAPVPVGVLTRSWERRLDVDRRYLESADGLKADARELLLWWHEAGARDRVRQHAPPEVFQRADRAVEAYNDALLDAAISLVSERLERYQVKYGPGSPRLNWVEVGLNALFQSTGPFRPNHQGPSPNELLTAYDTGWGTVADDKAQAVSTLEVGWRRYDLGWREGERNGLAAILRPRYLSVGLVVAEERDGALRWPLNRLADRTTRLGPFLSLGDLKVAYLFGPESRLMLSRQVQLLPNLF